MIGINCRPATVAVQVPVKVWRSDKHLSYRESREIGEMGDAVATVSVFDPTD